MPGYGRSTGEADFCGRSSQIALQSTIKYLRSRSDIDSDKIAVSGLSCGAIVAGMIADKERLAAMILISGVYDFEDMYKKWQTPNWKLESAVMSYIEKAVTKDGGLKAAASYRSALSNANQFKMPILLLAGGKDRIVDDIQSIELFKAVQLNGQSNKLVVTSEGGHMISYEDWVKEAIKFFGSSIKKTDSALNK